ncbi:hypothetical protein IHV25_01495 [Phaeovibrio sulfidiphilus]|uniref:Phage holin n=1 Tax=Phaeovibrio sulfidiphilus TaxID=1220600 RepID=A0A8J6YTV7_9PROT|nr:hypothetical protein [Phaeovibrio sulfidiphilus]
MASLGAGAVVGTAFVLLPGVDTDIALGAFAGSVLFVLSSRSYVWWKKILLFGLSCLVGLLGGTSTAIILDSVLHVEGITPGFGAVIASALAVRILMALFRRIEQFGHGDGVRSRPRNGELGAEQHTLHNGD